MSDPRDQAAALAATALVDSLMAFLERHGLMREGDRAEILGEAVAVLRAEGGLPSRDAARFIERAFRLPVPGHDPGGSERDAHPAQPARPRQPTG